MKKTIFLFLWLCAGFAQAKSLLCTVTPLTATRGGLVASQGRLPMITTVRRDFQDSLEYCTLLGVSNSVVSLCSFKAEFVGGYQVTLDVSPQGTPAGIVTNMSTKVFGSSRDSKDLIELSGNHMILGEVQEKIERARIRLPELTDDQLPAVSSAVGKAVRQGVLKSGDLVAVILNTCSIAK